MYNNEKVYFSLAYLTSRNRRPLRLQCCSSDGTRKTEVLNIMLIWLNTNFAPS